MLACRSAVAGRYQGVDGVNEAKEEAEVSDNNKKVNLPINQSINQPTNQSINQSTRPYLASRVGGLQSLVLIR